MRKWKTCVAAKKHDRKYIGIDISKEYCDLAEKRMKDFLGNQDLLF